MRRNGSDRERIEPISTANENNDDTTIGLSETMRKSINRAIAFTFGNVRNTVTFLMNGHVTHVTEENRIAIRTFAIQTDHAQRVFVDRLAHVVAVDQRLKMRFFLQPIDQQFEFFFDDSA